VTDDRDPKTAVPFIETMLNLMQPVAKAMSLPAWVHPVVAAIMRSLVKLFRSGRSVGEIILLLDDLASHPPGSVDLDAVEARVRSELMDEK